MLGASCQVIHGFDEYQTEAGDEAAAVSGGDGGVSAASGGGGNGASIGHGGDTSVGTGPPPDECDGNGIDGVCLAPIPEGWTGYFSVYSKPINEAGSECPDGSTPEQLYSGPSNEQAACLGCSCGGLMFGGCNAPLTAYSDAGCFLNNNDKTASAGCSSIVVDTVFPAEGVRTGQATAVASCPPSGGGFAQTPPSMWTSVHSLCGASGLAVEGCPAGDSCINSAGVPICIKKPGEALGCPDGWDSAMHLISYAGGTDDRGCAPCSCAPPPNLCSGGTYEFFTSSNCSGAAVNTALEGAGCTPTSGSIRARYLAPPPGGGVCTPAGGTPTGGVVTDQAVTLCCR